MSNLRIGLGEHSPLTIAGGPLRLGGVDIPHDFRLAGHSDADALLHAVIDALLGAAGLPDIGELFPNTDAAHRGQDSGELLGIVARRVADAGYAVVNLDCVVSAESPKLSPHKEAIRSRLADLLQIPAEQVNVKAKTGEGLGPVGQGELIEARCAALLEKVN